MRIASIIGARPNFIEKIESKHHVTMFEVEENRHKRRDTIPEHFNSAEEAGRSETQHSGANTQHAIGL